jgi:histidinol-phosphate aminotransferase
MALVPPYVASLPAYETGRHIEEVQRELGLERVIKLASNENPRGCSPKAIEAVREHLTNLNRYPNSGADLRAKLAARFGTKMENVAVGNGSEGIMAAIMRTFLGDEDEVLTTAGAFVGFQRLARSRGVAYRTVAYRRGAYERGADQRGADQRGADRDWTYDLEAMAEAINDYTKVIYLANPNNPTGTMFTRDEFDRFYRRVPERVLILQDEAYCEFVAESPVFPDSMKYRYDNVITLRTMSKAYGMAGFRVGYAFAHEDLIRNVRKVQLPFEPSTLSQVAAVAALDDEEFLRESVEANTVGRARLTEVLRDHGLRPVTSWANFVMIEMESAIEAKTWSEGLLREGIIVRPLAGFRLPNCVRVSVGTQLEIESLNEALDRLRQPV